MQSALFTRRGTERIVRAAFEAATEREGHLTSITKSNAQAHSMVFWDEVVADVSREFPSVDVEFLRVDADHLANVGPDADRVRNALHVRRVDTRTGGVDEYSTGTSDHDARGVDLD